MRLSRCHIAGFGKLRDIECRFGTGLNLVFAENEGGKSTLQRCIIGLLVGQWRADLKTQRRADPWVEKYKPWGAPVYGGALWCRLENGREVEIRRRFGKDDSMVEIRTFAGEDVTDQYEIQRNGEVLFAEHHLGLPKELFESLAVIRESGLAEIDGRETLRERLTNLAQAGSEKVSIKKGLEALESALDSIGSERAPTKPYRVARDQLDRLEEEARTLGARREEFYGWLQERSRLAEEVRSLEEGLRRAVCSAAVARWHDLQLRIRDLEELEGDLLRLNAEIDVLGAEDSFPLDRVAELDQLVGSRIATAKKLQETRDEMQRVQTQLQDAGNQIDALAPYERLRSGAGAQGITEWFVQYLNFSRQWEAEQAKLNDLRAEIAAGRRELEKQPPGVADPGEDWEWKAREAGDREGFSSRKSMALSEEIAGKKESIASLRGTVTRHRICAAGALIAALAAGILPAVFGLQDAAGLAALGLAGAFAVTALSFMRAASGRSGNAASLSREISGMEAERDRLREEAGQAWANFNRAVTEAGFKTKEGFLQAVKHAALLRARLTSLGEREAEAREKRDATQSELASVQERLKESLEAVKLAFSPADLERQVDVIRGNLRRLAALEADVENRRNLCQTLSAREEAVAAELEHIVQRTQQILAGAGVDSEEQFREAARVCRRANELRQKRDSRTREFDRLREGSSLEDLRSGLRDLERRKTEACAGIRDDLGDHEASAGRGGRLPLTPGIREAEENERRLRGQLATVREECARIVERVNQAFTNCRAAAEVEEDIAVARRELNEHIRNRTALTGALEAIETLLREQQEDNAPRLNQAVERRFLRLCGARYREAKIDPDFRIWLREDGTGELRGAESLSRGTQDQLYFALRFGILDLIASEEEPCPCLLDEPFAAYDRPRLAEAFAVLQEEAQGRQLILFTCREDVRDLAVARDAQLICLP